MIRLRSTIRLLVLPLPLVAAACSGMRADRDLPEVEIILPHRYPQRFDARVAILPVTRYEPSASELVGAMNGAPLLANYTFQQALIQWVGDTGLFAGATGKPGARYILLADIVEQKQVGSNVFVEIRYSLTDSTTGNILWSDDISTSDHHPPSPVAFVPIRQTDTDALWFAFRLNMERMTAQLAELPPTPQS
jgi:hypothetical protein